jgi:hypothetical protein
MVIRVEGAISPRALESSRHHQPTGVRAAAKLNSLTRPKDGDAVV